MGVAINSYLADRTGAMRKSIRQCMMVSAAAHDGKTAGAAKAGLRTATVARPDEFGPGSGPSTPKVAADIIAKDLNDLADKLGA